MTRDTVTLALPATVLALPVLVLLAASGAVTLDAQAPIAAFAATASVRQGDAAASFPVRVVVTRWSSEGERASALAATKAGAIAKTLGTMPDAGFIEIGAARTPIKFASERVTTGSGRIVTLATAAPIAFLGGGLPNAKPREGYDVAVVFLDLSDGVSGTGELAPAARVGITATGALTTTDYGSAVVWLKDVAREKAR